MANSTSRILGGLGMEISSGNKPLPLCDTSLDEKQLLDAPLDAPQLKLNPEMGHVISNALDYFTKNNTPMD